MKTKAFPGYVQENRRVSGQGFRQMVGNVIRAQWVHYEYDRPVDLSERGAGFIEGFAAACASLSAALTGDPDCGKSYDPMKVDLRQGTMHSYVFNMKDGGRHHPLVDYRSFQEIADVLLDETVRDFMATEPPAVAAALIRLTAPQPD